MGVSSLKYGLHPLNKAELTCFKAYCGVNFLKIVHEGISREGLLIEVKTYDILFLHKHRKLFQHINYNGILVPEKWKWKDVAL